MVGDEQLTNDVIGCAIEVHRELGPGLLESIYEQCLCEELSLAKIPFQRQLPLAVNYKGKQLDFGYRIDILAANQLVLELKCVEAISELHKAQLLTYLKLTKNRVGLILNFNVPVMRNGIKRLVL